MATAAATTHLPRRRQRRRQRHVPRSWKRPPSPTPSPTIPIDPCGEAPALTLTARTLPGARLDVGWSGVGHDLPVSHDTSGSADLNCPDIDDCTIDGSDLAGRKLGAPAPLSAAGVSLCVVSSFREAVTGTYDACNGCFAVSAALSVRVFPPQDADMPCPTCEGDVTPNNDIRGGTCRGGTTPGAACDVGAISDLFGRTSKQCQPTGSSIGEIAVDLNPLTTAKVDVEASVDCVSEAFPPASCFCPGQVRPNPCEPDGVCPASGVCESGPIDSVCQGQRFRHCRSGTGTDDCEAQFPGAGSCVEQPRPCFPNRIARTGACGTETSDLVSIFCVPSIGTAAIDSMIGLPGPGAITLPVAQVRSIRDEPRYGENSKVRSSPARGGIGRARAPEFRSGGRGGAGCATRRTGLRWWR